jgi:hypothetical protein
LEFNRAEKARRLMRILRRNAAKSRKQQKIREAGAGQQPVMSFVGVINSDSQDDSDHDDRENDAE